MFSLWLGSFLLIALNWQPSEIDRLIEHLGSPQFKEREAATKRLEAIGRPAAEALRSAATSSPDPEIRRRAETLLAGMKGQSIPSGKKVAKEPQLLGGNDGRARQPAPKLGRLGPQAAPQPRQNAIQDKELRWRAAYALWQADPRRGQEAIKAIQKVAEAWPERLSNLPPLEAMAETEAMLAATLEILDGKHKPSEQGQR